MSNKLQLLYNNRGSNFTRYALKIVCHDNESTNVHFHTEEDQHVQTVESPNEIIKFPKVASSQLMVTIDNPGAVRWFETDGYVADLEFSFEELNKLENATRINIHTVGNVPGSFSNLYLKNLCKFEFGSHCDAQSGSFDKFGSMKNLNDLYLHLPKCGISLAPLNKLNDLTRLCLYGYFDVNTNFFNSMPKLTTLGIGDFKSVIDLKYLQLPKLYKLNIDHALLKNIDQVARFTNLEKLYLTSTTRLEPFYLDYIKSLLNLRYLNLNYCEVAGTLQTISDLCELQTLILHGNKIFGELCDLKNLKELSNLNLAKTRVRGLLKELTAFNGMHRLTTLNLSDTAVSGSLNNLKSLENLEYLDLSHTTINGNLNDLYHCKKLQYLNLSNTGIVGSPAEFIDFSYLETLKLNDSYVNGNVNDMCRMPNLEKLYLSNTDMFGNAETLKDSIPSLKRFDYHHSRITGDWKSINPVNDDGMVSVAEYNRMKQNYENMIIMLQKKLDKLTVKQN